MVRNRTKTSALLGRILLFQSWVQPLEFDTSVVGGELPVNDDIGLISSFGPSSDFLGQSLFVRDATV